MSDNGLDNPPEPEKPKYSLHQCSSHNISNPKTFKLQLNSQFPVRGCLLALLAFSCLAESAIQPPTLVGDLELEALWVNL